MLEAFMKRFYKVYDDAKTFFDGLLYYAFKNSVHCKKKVFQETQKSQGENSVFLYSCISTYSSYSYIPVFLYFFVFLGIPWYSYVFLRISRYSDVFLPMYSDVFLPMYVCM